MQILMTTDTVGGVWTYCLELARALGPRGVHVHLAAKGNPTDDQVEAAESIGNLSLHVGDYSLEWMEDPWPDVQQAGRWLLELAGSLQPDVVHLNEYAHGALPWKAPVLMVGHSCVFSWMHAVRGQEPGEQWDRYRREVRRGLHGANLVVAPTQHMLENLARFYGPLRRRKVIPNGCDPRAFRSSDKEPFVFSAGRLWDEAKNLKLLAEASSRLDWPVHVAGLPCPGSEPEHPESISGIHRLGRLTAAEMAEVYAKSAVYALPAVYEPFGLTVLEAALSGCALVLGDIPTLRENWNGAALFVPPDDMEQLIQTINAVCREEQLRHALARHAVSRGQKFTADRMASEYYQSYCRLSNHSHAAAVA